MNKGTPQENTKNSDRKAALISGTFVVIGLAMAGLGITSDARAVLLAPGLIMGVIGLKFLIAFLWKLRTGKDTKGMQFWKWVGRKLTGNSQR